MQDREIIGRLILLNILRSKRRREHLSGCELYDGQFPVLECLILSPGSTQQQLAQQLGVTPASIAQSTKRLQKAGLIEKRVENNNLRCNRLYATEYGLATAQEYRRTFELLDAQTLQGLSEEAKQQLVSLLDRMVANINYEDMPICPPWRKAQRESVGRDS